ncbi:timeless protein-domain-containing protein [Suillus clintonianus]|uniref:timeless protein-domain-containing protein n=1 Tax=Suillus clintonianus TaxID=1904413 RepID=UPI001B86EFF1|nr:timeless protein-domain-containing protein [Suillus clintonianus]KAG2128288.1 timeless protein-domain-containing protein [Suillus clintonianus]
MDDDVVSIHSSHESGPEEIDRRAILEPVVQRVVDALGGYEGGAYRMGDEVSGCLRDLKKLWRKDDTDDERTVARIFWETRVLPNDLVPILLATAGKGLVEDKRAIACADLMTAMTWPIDMAEELQELDEELDKGTDYTQLMFSHLNYKAALLTPGVMQALFGIVLPPISKHAKERNERDGQIVNLVLHLIRNLIFIKDLPANMYLSADQAEYSSLQTRLVKALSETHTLDLLLTIAANTSNDPLFNASNTLVLEILYLLFRGVKPHLLAIDQSKQPTQNLHRLLVAEDKKKKDLARNASSRHSRFGTTVSVQLKPSKRSAAPDADTEDRNDSAHGSGHGSRPLVLHRQAAITRESGSVLDFAKRSKARKSNKIDELAREDNLSIEAKIVLQGFARESVDSSFNPFLRSLLKDIKSERPKIKEKDHLRLLYVTKWFLEFFLISRSNEKAVEGQRKWNLGLVAEVTDRGWIIWVLKRMRQAMEEKPKMWNELQAGIECLTQLLLLIDIMSSSVISDPQLNEAAAVLQQQLIYNGEVLDISLESLRSYKEGTQSLAYLNATVHLAYALLRMLERWGKENTGAVYVRKKKPGKRKKTTGQGLADEDGVPDVENEPDGDSEEEVVHETMFTFDAFEMKFANSEITKTLLTYLSRYRDFDSAEFMKRVVSLIHRQVVKAKAEGLYFNVSTLNLFKSILDDQKSLPKDQSSKDLVKLVNFILHRFFKALEEEPFLAVEAFFPKNRGHWKQYSSWEPERKGRHERETVEDTQFPPEVQVKKGYSWSEQIGIAIAALVEDRKTELVEWVKDILVLVIRQRNRIVEETDQKHKDEDTDLDDDEQKKLTPSADAISKFIDYLVPYISDEHAEAATKNSTLKLVFRLLKFTIYDEDGDELQWIVPAAIIPSELQSSLNVVDQFLQHPIDLDGKKASQLLSKKTRRRRRRRSPSNSDVELVDDDEPKRKRREKKKKEETQYKSAQFIEDSDAEYGDMEAFLEREKALRDKAAMAAAQSGKIGTMRAAGTKKRRRKGKDVEARKKGRVGNSENQPAGESSADENVLDSEDDILGSMRRSRSSSPSAPASRRAPRARPRPRPVPKRSAKQEISMDAVDEGDAGMSVGVRRTVKGRLVLSEDDEL